MLTTAFTETFGVRHPIVQGGMQWWGEQTRSGSCKRRRARHAHCPDTADT